ncbi:MAG: 1-acyl-sn-glycerol-3-phosphate acyltransferase [Bdellovibrionales bacterium]|nr:1-acyl-sn-glycerol-3-phosphate acyltransferase [Bdellovibrionales bacterium]
MQHVNKVKNQLSLLYFAVLGLVIYLIIAPFLIPLALFSLFFPKLMDVYYLILLIAIKTYLKISPLKIQKDLNILSRIDQRKSMIVCNHRSHLDMYLLLANVYKVRAVANAYLLKVPVMGQVLWMSGHFVVEAGDIEAYKKALVQIGEAFRRHDKVLIFPEMHRCPSGMEGIQKFRMTAFQLAREHKVEIIPVVLTGTDKVWPKGMMSMDFSQKVSIKALPAINPHDFKDTASLAKFTHQLMEEELRKIS